jgi:DNA primase
VPLFPDSFLTDLRAQADIVLVVQEYVSLRRVGNRYTGLCPFHSEKSPSFGVDRERGLFYCFGCGVGGNVFKFVELQERVSFPEAVRLLARKFGVAIPEAADAKRDAAADAEREVLLTIHEAAADFYRSVLADSQAGKRGRELLARRGVKPETIAALGYGFAPPGRDGLLSHLRRKGVAPALAVKSGLAVDRDGRLFDRFFNRLMIPIHREGGSIVAFGGRAMEADQQPKYLNSPETPIYVKGRTLYGLNVTKADIRKGGHAVLVEGYFDFAQAWQAGVTPVVATSGTALTQPQVQMLRRFTAKAVLSFDPDAAGLGAAVKSCDLLVREGFQVNVTVLPAGQDPDVFVRQQGGPAYQAAIDQARPYLDFLMERAAARHDLADTQGRSAFLNEMLQAAASIPDAPGRDYFADRIAHRAGITEDVVRQEIRAAAVARKTAPTPAPVRTAPRMTELIEAERDLVAQLVHGGEQVGRVLGELDEADLVGLACRDILSAARHLAGEDRANFPASLLGRLTEEEAALVTGIAARFPRPAPAAECVAKLKQMRLSREQLDRQRQIDALQQGAVSPSDADLDELLVRKYREAQLAEYEKDPRG